MLQQSHQQLHTLLAALLSHRKDNRATEATEKKVSAITFQRSQWEPLKVTAWSFCQATDTTQTCMHQRMHAWTHLVE